MSGFTPRVIPSVALNTNVSDGGATETAIITLTGVNTPGANATVLIHGTFTIHANSAATFIIVKAYRGTKAAGTQLNQLSEVSVASGAEVAVPFAFLDTPGEVAGQSYELTVTETSATGDGTVYEPLVSGMVF